MVSMPIARRDEGFSVAEVVMAAAILFFVLTAMIGLVGASQDMTVAAKRRTVVTNATAEYIERMRALQFEQLAIEPLGQVKASEEVVYQGHTVRFTNRVVFEDAQGKKLRTVYVRAECAIGGRTFTNSAVVHIKNPLDDTGGVPLVDPNKPVIEIVSPTPAANSVLYGQWVHPSYDLARIAADVRSPNDQIVNVSFKVGNVFLRDHAGVSGSDANFLFTPGMQDVSVDSDWDTTQNGVMDGFQTVVVYAEDDQGRWSTLDRTFIVDNVVPGEPGAPVGVSRTSTQAQLAFDAAPDPVPPSADVEPQTFASRYYYTLYREPSTLVSDTSAWSVVTSATVAAGANDVAAIQNEGPISAAVGTEPFSRYWAKVFAGSPRDFNWAQPSLMSAPFVSRPEVRSAGTEVSQCITNYTKVGSNRYTDYTVTLWLSKPSFPVNAGATTYELQAKQSASGSSWFTFTPQGTWTATTVGNYIRLNFVYREYTTAKSLWFRAGVNVTPTGWAGGAPTGLIYTNAAGTSPIDSNQSSASSVSGQLIPDATWSE